MKKENPVEPTVAQLDEVLGTDELIIKEKHIEKILQFLSASGVLVPLKLPAQSITSSRQFPLKIAEPNSTKLGNLASYYNAHLAREHFLLGLVRAQRQIAEAKYDIAKKSAYYTLSQSTSKKESYAKALDGQVVKDETVRKCYDKVTVLKALETVLEGSVKSLECYTTTISREISRRKDENEAT